MLFSFPFKLLYPYRLGAGICLEMSRFAVHSCLPNAMVLPGDGRTVRVIATAHISSLEEVRLQRDSGCDYGIMLKSERQLRLRNYFGYACECRRCRLGDADDPLRALLLRCPSSLSSSDSPNTACDGYCQISGHAEMYVPPSVLNSNKGPVVTGASAERCAKALFHEQLVEKLKPCSVCGSKYDDLKALTENLFPIVEFGSAMTNVIAVRTKSNKPNKVYEIQKRYLHPTGTNYKNVMLKKFCILMSLLLPDDGESDADFIRTKIPVIFAENAKYGADFHAYFEDRLAEIEYILAENNKTNKSSHNNTKEIELPPLHVLGRMWADSLNKYTLLCMDQRDRCRYEPDLYRRLQLVTEQLEEKAKVLLSRILTPKQLNRFYSKDY